MALSAPFMAFLLQPGCAGPGRRSGAAGARLHLHPGPAERAARSLSRSPPPMGPGGNELLVSARGRAFGLNFMVVNSKKNPPKTLAVCVVVLSTPFSLPQDFSLSQPMTALLSLQPTL